MEGGLGWGRGHLKAGDVCGDFSRWGARGPVGFVCRRQECTPPVACPGTGMGRGGWSLMGKSGDLWVLSKLTSR